MEIFDYIVIGGGTAGCVVAARLAENSLNEVLLLERGQDHTNDPRLAPIDLHTVINKELMEELPSEVLFSREKYLLSRINTVYMPRVLGGAPQISGAFWGRGDPENYNEWERLGNKGWNYLALLPFFKKCENFYEAADSRGNINDRGHAGPISVIAHDIVSDEFMRPLLLRAKETFKLNLIADYNTSNGQLGIAPMQRSFRIDNEQKSKLKYHRSTTYIEYIEKRKKNNLQVREHSTVIKLQIEESENNSQAQYKDKSLFASNIEYLHKGKTSFVKAKKEIILSAGAINTPKILLQSGIGDFADLTQVGVKPAYNLPGVGKNLQDHVFLEFSYILNPNQFFPRTSNSPIAVNFFKSSISNVIDIEIPWGALAGNPILLYGYIIHLRNKARGTVKLECNDPLIPPVIQFNWNPYNDDSYAIIEALTNVRKWLLDSNLAIKELKPGFDVLPLNAEKKAWQYYLSKNMKSIYHMAGTCRMGLAGQNDSVVDAELRLKGIENVRVADCSIMPVVVSQHPSCTATMIGEKLADMIMNERG